MSAPLSWSKGCLLRVLAIALLSACSAGNLHVSYPDAAVSSVSDPAPTPSPTPVNSPVPEGMTICPATMSPGDPDTSFGGQNGVSFGALREVHSLAVDPSGNLIVAGTVGISLNQAFALGRFLSNGTLDKSFAGSGYVTGNYAPPWLATGLFLTLDPAGGLLIAGQTGSGPGLSNTMGVASFTATGTIVFGTVDPGGVNSDGGATAGGLVIYPPGSAYAGTIVAVSTRSVNGQNFGAFKQFDSSGQSGSGLFPSTPQQYAEFDFATLQGDTLLIAGAYNSQPALFSIAPHGGLVIGSFTGLSGWLNKIASQPGKGLIVVGTSFFGGNEEFYISRIKSDLSGKDATFSESLALSLATPGSSFTSVAIQPDGKIVAVGHAPTQNGKSAAAVFRFLPDGNPDPAFGTGGMRLYPALTTNPAADFFYDVVIQGGRIVVGGTNGGSGYALRLCP